MNKLLKLPLMALMGAALALGFASCSDDNDGGSDTAALAPNEVMLQGVLKQFVNGTVNPTYKALSDSTTLLYEGLKQLKVASKANNVRQEDVNRVCEYFLQARANYEKSEAFLLGAADHFGIDPHIDSWPLDLDQLNNLLTSPRMINPLKFEVGDTEAEEAAIGNAATLGQNLLGFHGIEFILFRDGHTRPAAELNANAKDTYNQDGRDFTSVSGIEELEYATAVAGDLRNSVYRMECSWNENEHDGHKEVLDAFELSYVMDSGHSYGWNMINAGNARSSYSSIKVAVSAVLIGDKGAAGISDEVGGQKIGQPVSGEDISYIESPYSHQSINDFVNNMNSIENVWFGGRPETRDEANSFSAYFKKYDPAVGQRVETAIANAKTKIRAITDGAFVDYINNTTDRTTGRAAMDACSELTAALNAANAVIVANEK